MNFYSYRIGSINFNCLIILTIHFIHNEMETYWLLNVFLNILHFVHILFTENLVKSNLNLFLQIIFVRSIQYFRRNYNKLGFYSIYLSAWLHIYISYACYPFWGIDRWQDFSRPLFTYTCTYNGNTLDDKISIIFNNTNIKNNVLLW